MQLELILLSNLIKTKQTRSNKLIKYDQFEYLFNISKEFPSVNYLSMLQETRKKKINQLGYN